MIRALRRAPLLAAVALLACAGCKPKTDPGTTVLLPATSAEAASPAPPTRLKALLLAESARDPAQVHDDDLASGDLVVRRAAARALARTDDARARERLTSLVADLDPDVLSWAAFGLAQGCGLDREITTQRLVLRGASYRAEPPVPIRGLDPSWAIPRALGKCGHPTGERTLVAWLAGPRDRARASAMAIGEMASRHRRIEEETSAALLRAATGDAAQQALPEAFYPFSELKQAPPRARELLLERSRARLTVTSPARIFAVRALATLGAEVVPDLRKVLSSPDAFTPEERAEAARALGKIGGDEARTALVEAIDALAPPTDPAGLTALVSAGFPPLWTALDVLGGLDASAAKSSKGLEALATLPSLAESPAPLQRRLTLLRCAAARVLAGKDADAKLLRSCDPDPKGTSGAIARIKVLDRGPLKGTRLAAWRSYLAEGSSPKVREAALNLMSAHAEIADPHLVLSAALRAKEAGVVAVAAEQIALRPDRVFDDNAKAKKRGAKPASDAGDDAQVAPEIASALSEAIARTFPADAVETTAQLALAAGAVRLDQARAWLKALCKSPNVSLRASAQTALSSLERKKSTCEKADARQADPPPELEHLEAGLVQLTLATDVGELKLSLDPELAPVAVTRIVALARKGFYDGMMVHRAVAGFVVQFGDPVGDGYGGDGALPLRCELSPVPFDTGSVGIATAGRDTGSSQLFVTLSPTPRLEGQYTWIGKAEGPWNVVAEGDVIQKVEVSASAPAR